MKYQNIWRRVIGKNLMNISTSNISTTTPFPAFHQNCQAILAAASINGLKYTKMSNLTFCITAQSSLVRH